MGKKFSHLNQQTRDRIKALLDEGYSFRKIGRTLGIPHTTVSREIKRNSYSSKTQPRWSSPEQLARRGTYDPSYAQHKAYTRRRYVLHERKKLNADLALCDFVVSRLEAHWNPDEIAGYLKRHQEHGSSCGEAGCGLPYVSKTAIYEWLTTTPAALHRRQLYSQRPSRRKRRPRPHTCSHIPDRRPLTSRPAAVGDRQEPGHWEGDTMVSGRNTGSQVALVVVVERSSRLVAARLIPTMSPAHFAAAVIWLLGDKRIETLTLDNGVENAYHARIAEATGASVYFTDPYSSWQKGGVENANRMLRRYIPKGSDLGLLTQAQVDDYVDRINRKPRKILGYKSAVQVAGEIGVLTHTHGAPSSGTT